LIFLRASVFNYERLDILRDTIDHPTQNLLSFEFAQSFSFQLRASRYITGINRTSELKIIVVWFFSELPFLVTSVSIYYRAQSDIRVKSYCRLIFLRASIFNYERLDILRETIDHRSQNLLSFEFSQSSSFQLRASRYITGLNQTSELKIIVVLFSSELPFSVTCVSIYYGTQSDIRVKNYCRLIFVRASVFNYERLDILRDSIGHPSEKLLSFEFTQRFCFQLRASRYPTGLNWTSEWKVIVVWIYSELLFSIMSVSIYYETQSDIRVKSYCRLTFLRGSVLNFEHFDIL